MMIGTAKCPIARQLEAFSSGCLTDDDADVITEHLSHCSRCVAALEQFSPSDTIIDAFRAQTLQNQSLADAERVQQIIQAAKQFYGSRSQTEGFNVKSCE
jgi:anti-sigma factor RsiW